MDSPDELSQLNALARRVEAHGFICQIRHWGDRLAVYAMTPLKVTEDGLKFFKGALYAFPIEGAWEARIAKFGGAMWLARSESLDAMLLVIVTALTHPHEPLMPPWKLEEV